MTGDPDLPPVVAAYRDQLAPDERPIALIRALHTLRHLPPTARLGQPWSEDIGEGWAFHFNGRAECRLIERVAVLGRHLLVTRAGEPVLLINATGGWGQPADRDAFCDRLTIFIETLKGEAA